MSACSSRWTPCARSSSGTHASREPQSPPETQAQESPIAVYVPAGREAEFTSLFLEVMDELEPRSLEEAELAERLALLAWNLRVLCQAEGRNGKDLALREERACTEQALRSGLRRLSVEQMWREITARPAQ